MGLLNVYSFNKTIKPHIAYRFKVTFFYNKGAEEIESLTYYVKSVELPIWNMNTENRQRFGNTQYVIPIFDFGQSTLKIVFMETDKMSVTYFLNGFLFNNIENADMEANLWNNCAPKIIKIKIDELDQSMRNTVVSNIYACHLKRLSSPNFSNLNFGTPVEVEAEFVVRYKLNSIAEEIGEVHSSLPDPETFKEDIFNSRTQEEYNKNAALRQYNEAKTKALTTQRLLTQTEINAILMKQKERLNRAKTISADRRSTKLENARKDADKNGRLNDGTFVTAKEKAEYIKKKQAEAKLQEQKIKEEQAYIYDTYGVDVTKIKSVDELSVRLKGKLSDDDAADLVEAITSINETSDELKKIKQDIGSANMSRVIELSDDNMDKQYLGKYADNKSLSSGGQQYATEFADAENQLALLEKRSELIKNNASMEELMELDSQIAAANGISLNGTGASSNGDTGLLVSKIEEMKSISKSEGLVYGHQDYVDTTSMEFKDRSWNGDKTKGIDCSGFATPILAAVDKSIMNYATDKKRLNTREIQKYMIEHPELYEEVEVEEGMELKRGDIALRATTTGGSGKDQSRDHILFIDQDVSSLSTKTVVKTAESTGDSKNQVQGEYVRSGNYIINGSSKGGKYKIYRLRKQV